MAKKILVSGVQPTGTLHIGNYFGEMKQNIELGNSGEYESYIFIADYHALTSVKKRNELMQQTFDIACAYLACGLDPNKASLFKQSDVPEVNELTWIFNTITTMPFLMRAHAFKDHEAKNKEIDVGTFNYPMLMAADILLYEPDIIPVGSDQKQHIELTRDLAEKFNSNFGETFKIPAPVIPKIGARVMGLDDPEKKMSKSEMGARHAIFLLDEPDVIRPKIMKATTDSLRSIVFDESRKGLFNLLSIYQIFTGFSKEQIEKEFDGKGYGEFKTRLADVVIESLRPVREKYAQISNDPGYIETLLKDGAEKVRPVAQSVLKRVKDRVGLGLSR